MQDKNQQQQGKIELLSFWYVKRSVCAIQVLKIEVTVWGSSPRPSIWIVILILLPDILFGVELYCISFDPPES